MKNTIKVLGIIAIIAVIGFTMAACENDDDPGGNGGKTLTYKGTSDGVEWEMKIRDSYYELTKLFSSSNIGYTSTGTVNQIQGSTYYLKPSVTATMFTATVTSAGLVELQGTIVWYAGGAPDPLPGQLIPSGGTGNGGGNTPVDPVVPGENPDSGNNGNSEW
jgi:hypothetical protein